MNQVEYILQVLTYMNLRAEGSKVLTGNRANVRKYYVIYLLRGRGARLIWLSFHDLLYSVASIAVSVA
jgi:hypothetical protein